MFFGGSSCPIFPENFLARSNLFSLHVVTGDESLLKDMSERALKAAKPGASARIAHEVLSLIKPSAADK